MGSMIKAVIFDCFGVLVGRGFDETYRAAGGDPVADHDFITDLLGQTNLGLISEDVFHEALVAQLHISIGQWQEAVRQAEQPDYDLLRYIEKLHESYKTAILSNANVGTINRHIPEEWIKRCFDTVMVSGELGIVKPDPAIYRQTAKQLAVEPSECVFLDDIEKYLTGAAGTGMQTIRYRNFDQATAELDTLFSRQAT
jgi:epoxide hydrolase-like predicted phosphatase